MPPPAVTLTFDLLISKSNQYIYWPKYICEQNWVKFPSLVFLRYGVHKVFGTHRLTNSLTDGQIRIQSASATVFQRWRNHKNKKLVIFVSKAVDCSAFRPADNSGSTFSVCCIVIRRPTVMVPWEKCVWGGGSSSESLPPLIALVTLTSQLASCPMWLGLPSAESFYHWSDSAGKIETSLSNSRTGDSISEYISVTDKYWFNSAWHDACHRTHNVITDVMQCLLVWHSTKSSASTFGFSVTDLCLIAASRLKWA